MMDCDIEDFDDDEIIDECFRRGLDATRVVEVEKLPASITKSIQKIFELRRNNKDYQRELDDLIYDTIGRIL